MNKFIDKNSIANDKFTIDELLHNSWTFRNSTEFLKFFKFIAKFNHYSRYNTMLVYLQNSAVTFFGGVSYWKNNFNRTVKKDAKPYIILAPNGPVMLVYDIFDTEGKKTPEEFLEKELGGKPFEVKGEISDKIFSKAIEYAKKWGIKISYKPLSYFNAGYITTIIKGYLEICLKEGASKEEQFATLIHELSHLFLGHIGYIELLYQNEKKKTTKIQKRNNFSKTTKELEAETISYLICHKLGLETRSVEYIAGYIENEQNLIEFSYENVIKAADKIEKLFLSPSQKIFLPTNENSINPLENGNNRQNDLFGVGTF